jgi:hypothetical protein
LAIQAGMALADAYIVEIIRADALIDLLKQSRTETFAGPPGSNSSPGWSMPSLRPVGRLLAAEYRGRNFYVTVPLSAAPQESYGLRLRLSRWRWKLAGIELPETIKVRLVQEYQRRRDGR